MYIFCAQVVEECSKPMDIEGGTLLLPQLLIVRVEATTATRVRPLFGQPARPPPNSADKDRGGVDDGGWGVDGWGGPAPAPASNADQPEGSRDQQRLDVSTDATLRVPSRQRVRSRASDVRSRASGAKSGEPSAAQSAAAEQERDELEAVKSGDRLALLARVAELLKLEIDPNWTPAAADPTSDQTLRPFGTHTSNSERTEQSNENSAGGGANAVAKPQATATGLEAATALGKTVSTDDKQSASASEQKAQTFRERNELMERATPALLMEHTHDIEGAFFHAIEHLARLGVRGLLVGEFHAEPPAPKTAGEYWYCAQYRESVL